MITVGEARAVFGRRVDAWLAQDVTAYVDCWHDDMRIELPTGVIVGAAAYRKLVEASFAWAAPVSFDVHHFAVDEAAGIVFGDWTIRARRRDDDVIVEWRGLSVCELRDGRIAWWREHHLAPPAAAVLG
ncbi:MAG: nuclear transport factor 2 family protein [Acidimicrobiia bacterium]